MPGLVPGIHVLGAAWQGVDGRDKPGHDDVETIVPKVSYAIPLSPEEWPDENYSRTNGPISRPSKPFMRRSPVIATRQRHGPSSPTIGRWSTSSSP